MALEHLHESITKQNLWLYILALLRDSSASPPEIKEAVRVRFGFSPAKITFYSVLYKLRREGLVEKITDSFRSRYRITEKGDGALDDGIRLLTQTVDGLKAR